ncbi:hypothetical protein [Chitinibacter sp. S2-10]|uniref:hypothetical protein n=1 Tax=Chitinibacter sp. S2-10 TaxID=3373597 RepID=UPI003977C5F4
MKLKTLNPLVLPGLIIAAIALGMLIHGPIVQLPNYHHFADRQAWLGISNAADVLSNLGFALAGLWGMSRLARNASLVETARTAYGLFCISLFLTAFGSGWYHLAPDNARLIFDRIPIAMACAALLAAVCYECYGSADSIKTQRRVCAALTVLSLGSVGWWQWTEALNPGYGDLRPYLFLQVLPLLLIPIIQWQARAARAKRLALAAAIGLYIVAKVAELQDHQLFQQLVLISGHTLKHLLASAAAGVLVWQMGIPARR